MNITGKPPISARPAPRNRHTAPRRVAQAFGDPWQGWKPDWADTASPHRLQERQHPTEHVRLRQASSRDDIACQRRVVDARLWDHMTPHEQQAALAISMAYETMSRGLGFTTSNPARIPGGGGPNVADMHGRLINHYIDWTRACHGQGISHSMVLDVLAFGFSCKALDRDRRVRAGKTRQNLFEGLRLYCLLRGWPV